MRTLICLFFLSALCSCSWWQIATTVVDIVEDLPQDSEIEENLEAYLEEEWDMEEGSLDLTPFSPED